MNCTGQKVLYQKINSWYQPYSPSFASERGVLKELWLESFGSWGWVAVMMMAVHLWPHVYMVLYIFMPLYIFMLSFESSISPLRWRRHVLLFHWTVGTTEARRGWWQARTQIPWTAAHYFFGFWSEVFSQALIVGRRQHISNDLERGKKRQKKNPQCVVFIAMESWAAGSLDSQGISPKFLYVELKVVCFAHMVRTPGNTAQRPFCAHSGNLLPLHWCSQPGLWHLPWGQSGDASTLGESLWPMGCAFCFLLLPQREGDWLSGSDKMGLHSGATRDAQSMELAVRNLGSKSRQYNRGQIKWVFCGSADFSCTQEGAIIHVPL